LTLANFCGGVNRNLKEWCPFRLTDSPISLTFNPSESEFFSLTLALPPLSGIKVMAKSKRLEADGSKLSFEVRVTQEGNVIGKGLHRGTILKGTG